MGNQVCGFGATARCFNKVKVQVELGLILYRSVGSKATEHKYSEDTAKTELHMNMSR